MNLWGHFNLQLTIPYKELNFSENVLGRPALTTCFCPGVVIIYPSPTHVLNVSALYQTPCWWLLLLCSENTAKNYFYFTLDRIDASRHYNLPTQGCTTHNWQCSIWNPGLIPKYLLQQLRHHRHFLLEQNGSNLYVKKKIQINYHHLSSLKWWQSQLPLKGCLNPVLTAEGKICIWMTGMAGDCWPKC